MNNSIKVCGKIRNKYLTYFGTKQDHQIIINMYKL